MSEFYQTYFSIISISLFFVVTSVSILVALKTKSNICRAALFLFFTSTARGFYSLHLIEKGSFIIEQSKFGYPNFASLYFAIFSLISICACWLALRNMQFELKDNYSNLNFLLYFILFLFQLYLAFDVRLGSIELNKFDPYLDSPLKRLFSFTDLAYFAAFNWFTFSCPNYAALIFANHIILGFVKEHYFSTLVSIGINTVLLSILLKKVNFKVFKFLFFIIPVALVIKAITLDRSFDNLFNRFVLDAHMFWGSINSPQNPSFAPFLNNFFNTKLYGVNPFYGVGELMVAISPSEYVQNFFKYNIRFTNGYPAILIHKFGLMNAFFIHLPLYFIYFKVLSYTYKLPQQINILSFIILYKFIDPILDFSTMGEYGYFKAKYFVYTFICILLVYIEFKLKLHQKLETFWLSVQEKNEKYFDYWWKRIFRFMDN